MPNGKPGDHPLTDILIHRRRVYSPLADYLVEEIVAIADEATKRELGDMLFAEYNAFAMPNIPELEQRLTELHDRLRKEQRRRADDNAL